MEALQAEVQRFEAAYRESKAASGPTKWPRFAEFLRDAYGGAVRDLAARQEERQRAAAAQAAQAAEHARQQAQQVRGWGCGAGNNRLHTWAARRTIVEMLQSCGAHVRV